MLKKKIQKSIEKFWSKIISILLKHFYNLTFLIFLYTQYSFSILSIFLSNLSRLNFNKKFTNSPRFASILRIRPRMKLHKKLKFRWGNFDRFLPPSDLCPASKINERQRNTVRPPSLQRNKTIRFRISTLLLYKRVSLFFSLVTSWLSLCSWESS